MPGDAQHRFALGVIENLQLNRNVLRDGLLESPKWQTWTSR